MNKVQYTGYNSQAGPSPAIWADCPWLEMQYDPGVGYCFFDDFLHGFITPTITTLINVDGYACFGSAGATITWDDALGGAVIITEATDNEAVGFTTENHPYWISQDYGKLWFEARIKSSTITTLQQGFFVGLMDTTAMTAILPIAADGTLGDANLVGFFKPEADTTTFDSVYKANAVAAVTVNDGLATIAANTYIKIGMIFDPTTKTTGTKNQLAFFIDGVQQATAKTIPNATGTDFPADIGMGLCFYQHLGAGVSVTLTMDWWRIAQLRTS